MIRLAAILYLFIGTTAAGSAMVAALTMGHDTTSPILIAAGLGAAAALPLTWIVARMLYRTA